MLANHGTCAACVCAMSGIDLALWDVKGKALGYAEPAAVAEEAGRQVAGGYRAVKLRLGDTLNRDIERTQALRSELGPDVALLADANCRYSVDDVRAMLPVLAEAGTGWLEEPFPP